MTGAAPGASGVVLVCDDEPAVRRAVAAVLRGAGFEPLLAGSIRQAAELASERRPVAALLDLRLPDGDGAELTAVLRARSSLPILMLSQVGDEAEKVRALEAGADDFVTKPFAPDELVARLRAHLRRAATAPPDVVQLGDVEVDLPARLVSVNGRPASLTPTEWELLALLVRERPRVVPYGRLLDRLWGSDPHADPHLVRVHAANLRAKLGAQPVLRTERGVGLRILPP